MGTRVGDFSRAVVVRAWAGVFGLWASGLGRKSDWVDGLARGFEKQGQYW